MDNGLSGERSAARWTSRSIGSNLQHNIFYALIKIGGHRTAYVLLSCVAVYYTLFRPGIRKKAYFYLTRRFGNEGFYKRLLHCYHMYESLGRALIDRAAIGIRGADCVTITFEDQKTVHDLIREGHGIILLTAHVGCWQATMERLRVFNTPVSLLLHREEGNIDRHFFEHTGTSSPFRIIDPAGYMGGVLEMMEVLKKGEILSIMGDRTFGTDRNTVAVDFLGGRVSFALQRFQGCLRDRCSHRRYLFAQKRPRQP